MAGGTCTSDSGGLRYNHAAAPKPTSRPETNAEAAVATGSHTPRGFEAPQEVPLSPSSDAAAGGPSHGLIHTGRNPSGSVNLAAEKSTAVTARSKSMALHLHSTAPQVRSGLGMSRRQGRGGGRHP